MKGIYAIPFHFDIFTHGHHSNMLSLCNQLLVGKDY